MSVYTVIDTLTNQVFPADTLADVEQAVGYILDDGTDHPEWEVEKVSELLLDVREVGWAISRSLGLEVVSHV
jgi:hypothetical protein